MSRRALDAEEFHVTWHIRGKGELVAGGGEVRGQRRPSGQIR